MAGQRDVSVGDDLISGSVILNVDAVENAGSVGDEEVGPGNRDVAAGNQLTSSLNLDSACTDCCAVVGVCVDDDVSVSVRRGDRRADDDVACCGECCRCRSRNHGVDDGVLAGTVQRHISCSDSDDGTGIDGCFVDRQQSAGSDS